MAYSRRLKLVLRLFHLNVSKFFKVQKKKQKVVVLCFRLAENFKLGSFTLCSLAVTAKKCTKKHDTRASLLLIRQGGFPNIVLGKMQNHEQ